jgi:hypothetical protein
MQAAQRTLSELQERIAGEDAAGALSWFRVDQILESHAATANTRFYALQILEGAIKYRWKTLPQEQQASENRPASDGARTPKHTHYTHTPYNYNTQHTQLHTDDAQRVGHQVQVENAPTKTAGEWLLQAAGPNDMLSTRPKGACQRRHHTSRPLPHTPFKHSLLLFFEPQITGAVSEASGHPPQHASA